MDVHAGAEEQGERARRREPLFRIEIEAPRVRLINMSEFRQHLRNAQKEMLLAFRSLIDEAIERMERSEEEETRTRRTSEIRVE
ncbi:MAG: hypothetical protein C4289_03325 [Chloroflexota bacterium]